MQVLNVWKNSVLGSFLVLQELDVVDQEHVHVAVPAAEPVALPSRIMLMKSLVNSSEVTYRTFTPW